MAITRHDTPKFVLVSYAEFKSLVAPRGGNLDLSNGEFEALAQSMQTPKAKKAMAAAFNGSPAQLGSAVVKAASRVARTEYRSLIVLQF